MRRMKKVLLIDGTCPQNGMPLLPSLPPSLPPSLLTSGFFSSYKGDVKQSLPFPSFLLPFPPSPYRLHSRAHSFPPSFPPSLRRGPGTKHGPGSA